MILNKASECRRRLVAAPRLLPDTAPGSNYFRFLLSLPQYYTSSCPHSDVVFCVHRQVRCSVERHLHWKVTVGLEGSLWTRDIAFSSVDSRRNTRLR